jgi:uncharacterized protein
MAKQASNKIDPFKLAARGESEAGSINLANMSRLAENIHPSSKGDVTYEMRFFKERKHFRVSGQQQAVVNMICQRCLQPMPVSVSSSFNLEFVREEPLETEADSDENIYEWVMVPDEPIALSDLVEDELMLALPFAPMHDEGSCPSSAIVKELQESSKPNPFAVLKELKGKQES